MEEKAQTRKSLGYLGEELAAKFLQSKGYEIIKNNFTVRGGEIDIVARQKISPDSSLLVFVEVKTRTGKSFGTGDESFNHLKKRRIVRAIERYLQDEEDYRIDLIEIELDPTTHALKNIYHYKDVEL